MYKIYYVSSFILLKLLIFHPLKRLLAENKKIKMHYNLDCNAYACITIQIVCMHMHVACMCMLHACAQVSWSDTKYIQG